jgi:hypothetical protein
MVRPKIFVGSSVESLSIANAVHLNMDYVAEITVWTQGIFELSKSSLDSLIEAAPRFDYAIFVFASDDVAHIRNMKYSVARDNVVFELGLFMGVLGKANVFFITPRGIDNLHLPTDLLGITAATFDPNRSDKNLKAALGPACTQITETITSRTPKKEIPKPTQPLDDISEHDSIVIIQAWLKRELRDVLLRPHRHHDIDAKLLLPSGTSARYTAKAVTESGEQLTVAANNADVIQIVEKP